jgi:glycosyltransferase involved in cell wall biosynthesis
VLGTVADLGPLYDRARVFIAPTRFAAGIPYKVHHAAAHGLPTVVTGLLAEQLGWRDGHELLAAGDARGFASACARVYRDEALWRTLRAGALARLETDCAWPPFAATVEEALS